MEDVIQLFAGLTIAVCFYVAIGALIETTLQGFRRYSDDAINFMAVLWPVSLIVFVALYLWRTFMKLPRGAVAVWREVVLGKDPD